ncbi:MAG: hypothetical protein HC842_04110 [Cytophagales bacterium]|nr:hypothetical protein [Cytophagales bacterium]
MKYEGYGIPLPLGTGSLHTDDDPERIPITNALVANSVTLSENQVSKAPGARRYNTTPLPSPIVGLYDWWPNSSYQSLVALCENGSMYVDLGDGTFRNNTAVASDLGTLNNSVYMVSGGSEVAGSTKKLFVLSPARQVRYLDGTSLELKTIENPALDWASSYPKISIPHRNRMFTFGNSNRPHTIIASDTANHRNYTSNVLVFDVYPGEGDSLIGGFVYKTKLFILKRPFGVYSLVDTDINSTNWYFTKVTDEFGAASAHSSTTAVDDRYIGNNTGTITSIQAAFQLGDVSSADVMTILRIERFIRENTRQSNIGQQHSVYYKAKKQAFFTYQSTVGQHNDRVLVLDFNQQKPRAYFWSHLQPTCLALRRDIYNVERPIYGAQDGHVYFMDTEDRDVGGSAYTGSYQTPFTDFAFAEPQLGSVNKNFDFVELKFHSEGVWPCYCDVFIDDDFSETLSFDMHLDNGLDIFKTDSTDNTNSDSAQSIRRQIRGGGKRISLRFYNSGYRENFTLTEVKVYFTVSGVQQKMGLPARSEE